MKAALTVALVLLAGCGLLQPEPDFYVDGVGVKLETDTAWARADDFADRLQFTSRVAIEEAGGGLGNLAGWVIVFKDGAVDCGSKTNRIGCAEEWRKTITVSTGHYTAGGPVALCVEQTALVHEVSHVMAPDPCHRQALWSDFQSVAERLRAAEPTYADGLARWPCPVEVYSWTTQPNCG